MHVVLVAGYAPSLLNFRGPLIEALVAAGHRVTALAPPEGPEQGAADAEIVRGLAALGAAFEPIPLSRGGLNPLADLGALIALRSAFLRLRPDLALCYTVKAVLYGLMAARLAGVRRRAALITGLGYAFSEGGGPGRRLLSALVRGLYRRALAGCRMVFFQNPDDRAFFADLGLTAPGQPMAVVAGSGVDLERFAPAPPLLAHAQTGGPVFLCVARLLWAKGVGVFVEACRLLKARHPQAVCRLIGPEDIVPDAVPAETLRQWRAEGLVELPGAVADVRPELAAASVFVLPSFREGTPRSVLEAMAVGRPVVTTDVPGCRQTVEPGVTGYLVPAADPQALAEAMERFVLEPERIAHMGAAARALAEERFDARLVAQDMLQALGLDAENQATAAGEGA